MCRNEMYCLCGFENLWVETYYCLCGFENGLHSLSFSIKDIKALISSR
jgi:hypothetical protein